MVPPNLGACFMQFCHRLSNILSAITLIAARFAGLMLLVLTGVIIYDVVGRRFFSTGSYRLQELEWHIHGAIAVLAFGYAYTRNAHVRVDVLADRIPPRLKLWLEIVVISLFLIPFLCLLIWYGYEFAERAFVRKEGSNGGLGLPDRWIVKSLVPLSAGLAICGAVSVALRCLVVLQRPDILSTPFVKTGLWKR